MSYVHGNMDIVLRRITKLIKSVGNDIKVSYNYSIIINEVMKMKNKYKQLYKYLTILDNVESEISYYNYLENEYGKNHSSKLKKLKTDHDNLIVKIDKILKDK